MKSPRIVLSILLLATASLAFSQTAAQKSFDQIKSLSGTWEGKNSLGEPLAITFRSTSAGSAVMSEISGHGPDNMITMFHLDGPDRLLMTHYCGSGNQPRMVASPSCDGKTIAFNFLDATNLATPDAGHMQRLVVTVLDANHHTEEWTFTDHGKQMKELFDLQRKM
jgi:hypothetical protein